MLPNLILKLTAAGLSEVYPNELDHVGLQQVHVPPRGLLNLVDALMNTPTE